MKHPKPLSPISENRTPNERRISRKQSVNTSRFLELLRRKAHTERVMRFVAKIDGVYTETRKQNTNNNE
ncbi:unnamed protein product [Ectocarpus sp. 6 AP-2014]